LTAGTGGATIVETAAVLSRKEDFWAGHPPQRIGVGGL
jgi:hypothetical protein